MSASPVGTVPAATTKRPLEDESSTSGPTDQPDAKRPALDKATKAEEPEIAAAPDATVASAPVIADDSKADDASLTNGHAADGTTDTVVTDAPTNGAAATAASITVQQLQPIQSTAEQHDRAATRGAMPHPGPQDESGWIHVRAVISSAEAATVIGKGGENVSQIRKLSGAKCTVSDYSRGAVERILTVSGMVDAMAKVRLPLFPLSSHRKYLRQSG